jgi:nitrate/nitrite transport system substrate-binding protein
MDLNGNAITVSNALYERMLAADAQALDNPKTTAHALKQVIEQDRAAGRPALSFAMVFPMSSHHYALRYWMAAAGIDPDNDVRLTVIPPPQMVNYLQAGLIDGYCVGEPWNSLAVRSAIGRVLITSYDIWNNHPEKVFAVHRDWAEHYPNTHHALLMALLESAQWLDQPHNRLEAADILAYGRYVNVPSEILQMSMTGTFQYAADQAPVAMPDFNVFYRYAATCPWRSHALWFLTQMIRCGQLDRTVDIRRVAASVYRPDFYGDAAAALGLPYPGGDEKIEGIHPEPWQLERNISEPINMGADMFFDGKVFDSAALSDPVEHFAPESEEISESS